MKEYKVVCLNPKMHFSRKKDLIQAEEILQSLAEEGWELDHVVSPNDFMGAIVGVFSRDKE